MPRQSCELFTITLELNSAPVWPMSTRALLVNGSAGRSQVTSLEINCSGPISSHCHRNWCDLTQPAWWPWRQPWTHPKRKCRQCKLWVHTLLDKGISFKAPESNQHIANAFQPRLCQGNKNWVFFKVIPKEQKKRKTKKPKDLLAGKWQKASSHALSSVLKN